MRTLAVVVVLVFGGIAVACFGTDEEPRADEGVGNDRPNVLIFVTDDQRTAGTLRVMSNVERWFGRGGTRFKQAYATTPLCCPFRATMFSGRYAHNHGVERNQDDENLDQDATMQRYLRDEGYTTALVGKFLNDWPIEGKLPNFDRWAMYESGSEERGNIYNDALFNIDGEVKRIEGYNTRFVASRAVSLLQDFEADDGTPWLMFVTPYAPHAPFDAEEKYRGDPVPPFRSNPAVREKDRSDKPDFVRNDPPVERHEVERRRKRQLRTLYSVDDLVDRVMSETHRLGEDNTISFFASDGGYLWGEHGLMQKKLAYTNSISIPLFMRWPDRVPAGETDNRVVANVDMLPTILEATGSDPELVYPLDGMSILGDDTRPYILSEHFPGSTTDITHWASLRASGFQYIEHYAGDGSLRFREYYDLRKDPWQLLNVLGDDDPDNDPSPERLLTLRTELEVARSCSGAACP